MVGGVGSKHLSHRLHGWMSNDMDREAITSLTLQGEVEEELEDKERGKGGMWWETEQIK
mgnify:CR=1 FL=1